MCVRTVTGCIDFQVALTCTNRQRGSSRPRSCHPRIVHGFLNSGRCVICERETHLPIAGVLNHALHTAREGMNELKRAESCCGQQPPRSRWLRDTSRFYDGERKRDLHNITAAAMERMCLIFSEPRLISSGIIEEKKIFVFL